LQEAGFKVIRAVKFESMYEIAFGGPLRLFSQERCRRLWRSRERRAWSINGLWSSYYSV